jgi:hypothetical protein
MMELESVPSTARTVSPRAPAKTEPPIESKKESRTEPRPAAKMARKIAQLRQPREQKHSRTKPPTSKTEISKR